MKPSFAGVLLIVLTIAVILFLAGCVPTRPSKAIDVHCDGLCFANCDPLTAWDGDRDGARLTALFDADDVVLAVCDQRRALCVACIETARKAGAIQ